MVALIVASSSPLSFTIFVVILSASIIFGGEIVVAQKKPPLSCASSLAPGNEKCDGGFCFDLFDIQSDSIKSGCTHSPTKCPSSGCFLLPNAQKFLCCCSHPFCNGKSPYLIKARWRMYLKGDYPAKVLRKSPRDVSREMAEDNIRNVDSMENGTTKTMATKKATTPASVKMATTTMKKAPTASSSTQKPTTTKTAMTTKKPAIVNKTITTTKSPNNSTKTIKTTKTTKATVPTTNSPPKTTQKTSTLAINLTEFGANKSEEQIEEKGMEILDFNGNETNSKEKEEKTVDSGTTVAAKIEKEMPKATTEKMMDVKNSTLLPSSSTMMRTKVTPKQSTTISGPFEITKVSTIQMNETTTIQSKSTNSPSSTSPKNENVPMFSSTAKSTSIKPSYSEPFTAHSSSKRTTRSPSPQPPTTIRTTLGPWEPAVPSFPWYFIALAGFLSSSAVFLLVYWTVKGCRRIFQKRMRNGRRGGDDGGQLGEPMIPMGNGQNSNGKKAGKTAKMEKESRPKKRAVTKANGQMMMSSKTTNESLMSQCTASTGIGEQQNQKIPEIGMEYGGGEQVTVIDPLLNQQYNGTMNK